MYDKTYKRQSPGIGFIKTVLFMVVLVAMVIALLFAVYGNPDDLDAITNRPVIAANTAAPTRQVASPNPTSSPISRLINVDDFLLSEHVLVLRPTDLTNRYRVTLDYQYPNGDLVFQNGSARDNYLSLTGRVDGWETTLERMDTDVPGPYEYTSRVEVFETVAGAADAISPEYFWAYTNSRKAPDELINNNCVLGSECVMFQTIPPSPKSGEANLRYDVAFRYQNVVVWISISGDKENLTKTQALDVAGTILEKLQNIE